MEGIKGFLPHVWHIVLRLTVVNGLWTEVVRGDLGSGFDEKVLVPMTWDHGQQASAGSAGVCH